MANADGPPLGPNSWATEWIRIGRRDKRDHLWQKWHHWSQEEKAKVCEYINANKRSQQWRRDWSWPTDAKVPEINQSLVDDEFITWIRSLSKNETRVLLYEAWRHAFSQEAVQEAVGPSRNGTWGKEGANFQPDGPSRRREQHEWEDMSKTPDFSRPPAERQVKHVNNSLSTRGNPYIVIISSHA